MPIAPPFSEPTNADLRGAVERSQSALHGPSERRSDRLADRTPPPILGDFRPIPAALGFLAAAERYVAVCAGVRGGKSTHAAAKFLARIWRDLRAKPGYLRYWCLAPTYDLADVQYEILGELLDGSGVTGRYNQQRHVWTFDALGFSVAFKSADTPKHLRARGIDGLWITEAGAIRDAVWSERIRSRLADKSGWCLFDGTPEGLNWWYEFCHRSKQLGGDAPDLYYATWTTADNTAVPALVEEMERARAELPEEYFQREWCANWTAFRGQVYKEFNKAIHVVPVDRIPPRDQWRQIRVGADWGYENPGVQVWCVLDSEGRWWVIDEVYEPGRLCAWWVDRTHDMTRQWGRPMTVRCDPSRPDLIAEFRVGGIVQAIGADNAVAPGIATVAKLLHPRPATDKSAGGPKLFISAKCVNLIKELQSYRYAEGTEEPIKTGDHAVDALRYALHWPAVEGTEGIRW